MDVYQNLGKESVSHLFATYCRDVYPINAQGGGLSWTIGSWLYGLERLTLVSGLRANGLEVPVAMRDL